MQLSDLPVKFNIAFASSAAAGYIRTVPQTPTGTPGQASLQQGFPPENFQPPSAGGTPPFGQDFNGIINQITKWNQWQATGVAFPPYDSAFQTAIGGYPHSAIVASLVSDGLLFYSLVDNNVTNPDTGGAGWLVWRRLPMTANTDLYVDTAAGNDNNNGLTPSTAKKTIQAAVNTAWTFPPSSAYSITIHVADGTYSESVTTPMISGPSLIITGNSTTPSNVLISSTSGNCFTCQGSNTLTVQNLKVTNTSATSSGFSATNGGQLTTSNTVSGAVAGWVFLGNGSGTITVGTHSFVGNCGYLFAAYRGGNCVLNGGATYSVAAGGITVTDTVIATSGGQIEVPGTGRPVFSGGAVTGARYSATLNGVINTQGAGTTYFPGTVAGSTATGGQYA